MQIKATASGLWKGEGRQGDLVHCDMRTGSWRTSSQAGRKGQCRESMFSARRACSKVGRQQWGLFEGNCSAGFGWITGST